MACEQRRRSSMVLNLTPLIDIVFLLLIFFMLTSRFIEEQQIPVDLPDARISGETRDDAFVQVTLTPDGRILVAGEEVPLEALEQRLRQALKTDGRRFVRLRGDEGARFGLGVQVIDAARNAGAASVDILTERP